MGCVKEQIPNLSKNKNQKQIVSEKGNQTPDTTNYCPELTIKTKI